MVINVVINQCFRSDHGGWAVEDKNAVGQQHQLQLKQSPPPAGSYDGSELIEAMARSF